MRSRGAPGTAVTMLRFATGEVTRVRERFSDL